MKVSLGAMSLLVVLVACTTTSYPIYVGPSSSETEQERRSPDPTAATTPPGQQVPPARQPQTPRAPLGARSVPPSLDPSLIRIDLRALEQEIFASVNRERARGGSAPLTPVAGMNRTARRYALELAERGEVEHESTTPGRRTFRQRIEAEGTRADLAGENLAMLTASPELLASQVVKAWLRSPGHSRNLLDSAFARSGLGAWLGPDGVWYVVQVFASPT